MCKKWQLANKQNLPYFYQDRIVLCSEHKYSKNRHCLKLYLIHLNRTELAHYRIAVDGDEIDEDYEYFTDCDDDCKFCNRTFAECNTCGKICTLVYFNYDCTPSY